MSRAALEELDLDLSHASADLEHRRVLDPPLFEELDHALRVPVEPAFPVALRGTVREAVVEELVAAARIAATCHVASLATATAGSRHGSGVTARERGKIKP